MARKQITTIRVLERKLCISFVFENYCYKGVAVVEFADRPILFTISKAFF